MRVRGKCEKLLPIAALLACLCMTAHAAGVKADAINELTPDAGVTVDGVSIKDGAVTSGAWNGSAVPVANGGTGAANATDARANLNIALPATGTAHVVVQTTDDPATNAANLLVAYTAAKALEPNGAALATDNRAVVLVPPGAYDLGASSLVMDTEFVDIEGLSNDREKQHIYRDGHVLTQTASDVRIENLLLHYTGTSSSISAYYPNASGVASPAATTIRNCEFRVNSGMYKSMRDGVEYAGTYEDCLANGEYTFGGGGTASGTFTNCTGGNYAFAADNSGVASGTFANCTADDYAFGGAGGTASGTFTNCTADALSFGGGGTASGSFKDCTGGMHAFGSSYGTASGTFINCTGGQYAFGGSRSTASGTFTNCTGGTSAFGAYYSTASGTFTNCTGGEYAFGGNSGGTASGIFINCTGDRFAFGYYGDASGGKFFHCFGADYTFTESGTPAPYHHVCFQNGALYSGND